LVFVVLLNDNVLAESASVRDDRTMAGGQARSKAD
jgi:hypothetical protein